MKILWIISSGWKEGGAENYLVLLKPHLESLGNEVRIFAGDDRKDMPHFSDYEFPVHRGVLGVLGATVNVGAYRALKKVLHEYQPDIVHIHTIGHASPLILFALKGYQTALTFHGPEGFLPSLLLRCFPSSYFRKVSVNRDACHLRLKGIIRLLYHRIVTDPLYAVGLKNISVFISPSKYMEDIARQDGFTSVLVPNGTTLFAYAKKETKDLAHRIAFAGRLEKGKGVDVLLRAFQHVYQAFPDARLMVAGDGVEKTALIQLAQELRVESAIDFLGYVDRSRLEDLYVHADIAVMPSVWTEAFGLSGVEAMSVGRPVVASRIGGIPEWLIDGETGYLVPSGDVAALAEAIQKIFADPDLLARMMEHARKRAEEFSIEVHARRIQDLYTRLLRK